MKGEGRESRPRGQGSPPPLPSQPSVVPGAHCRLLCHCSRRRVLFLGPPCPLLCSLHRSWTPPSSPLPPNPSLPAWTPSGAGGSFCTGGAEGKATQMLGPTSPPPVFLGGGSPPLNPPSARETFGVPEPGPAPCATRSPGRGCRALPPPIPRRIPTPALPGPDPGTRRWEGHGQTRASLIGRPLAPPAGRFCHCGRGQALRRAWPEQRWGWAQLWHFLSGARAEATRAGVPCLPMAPQRHPWPQTPLVPPTAGLSSYQVICVASAGHSTSPSLNILLRNREVIITAPLVHSTGSFQETPALSLSRVCPRPAACTGVPGAPWLDDTSPVFP